MIKPATIPSVTSILNTEFESLPFPNEILLKIFGYLNIKDISRSAKVCHQFNKISNDPSLWKSMGKLCIGGRTVPTILETYSTEFLTYIIQRGITELGLFRCVILPPKVPGVKLTKPLSLKTLSLNRPMGDKTLLHEILTSHPLEKVDFMHRTPLDISQFIKSLPQIGSKLKSLKLILSQPGIYDDLTSISLIVNNCLDLEELKIFLNCTMTTEAIAYLCENLTTNILKLDIKIGGMWNVGPDKGLNDNNIRALVKRCPKLKVLDVRYSKNVTHQGLVAISNGLLFLECLALSKSVGNELGLPGFEWINGVVKISPYNINGPKMDALKSMGTLKELLIGFNSASNEYQSILKSEIPQLRISVSNDFGVASTIKKDFRAIQF